jgi:hypothetical protein
MKVASVMKIAARASAELAAMLEALMGKSSPAKAVMIPAAAGKAAPIKASAIVTASVPARMAPIRVIPRPDADEDAVHEPLRAVVAIGRAGVRIIVIISIGTNRGWTDISRANSDANDHPLGTGKGSAKQANAE